jgi:cobalt-zinc-cadmium efflux system membrane fusion protein
MTESSRLTLRWAVAAIVAVLLVATGAVAAYLLTRPSQRPTPLAKDTSDEPAMPTTHGAGHAVPASPGAPTPAPGATLPDVTVTLTKDAVERAGIRVTAVTTANGTAAMRIPGVVEPNAYKQVVVTPLVAGRITRVLVELGQHVKRGETMAQIFSPELAEAQTKFISARAELEAHERELRRTEKLVEIGAASRQELERIHAEHTARTADVQSARSRLALLGVSGAAADSLSPGKSIGATTSVPAPIAGVVTERLANVGLNVDTATKLFTVIDLATVWVVADVYEKDFSRVRIGSAATITTAAYPDLALQGRISYIDPQVSPDTRTAKVRVEVRNARDELRLGMFADVLVGGSGQTSVPVIPRSAVQTVGDRQVVYLVNPKEPGTFVEREVRLGQPSGEQVEVLSGVKPGDVIVTQGSFFVRAERDRLGLRPQSAAVPRPRAASDSGSLAQKSGVPTARVTVGDQGFEPSRLSLRAGVPSRVTFVRTSEKTCAKEVAFPSLKIKRALPLNQPVVIEFTPSKAELAFTCGMNMLRGTIVAE